MLSGCKPTKGDDTRQGNNNQLTTVNQTLGARLKTVNLSSFLSKQRANNTLYGENSVDVSTKEVY
jgi:hypothetical protein